MSKFSFKDKKTMYSRKLSLNEMQQMAVEIADHTAGSPHWYDRVLSFAKATGFQFSRAKGFYYRTTRTVEDHEKQTAKSVLRELEAKKKAHEQLIKLHSTLAFLRQTDEDFHQPSIDQLERSFSSIGILDSPLDEPAE